MATNPLDKMSLIAATDSQIIMLTHKENYLTPNASTFDKFFVQDTSNCDYRKFFYFAEDAIYWIEITKKPNATRTAGKIKLELKKL